MIKTVLCSNFLDHHMLPLCSAFLEQGCEFYFIANEPVEQERLKFGYSNMNDEYPFVIRAYQSVSENERAHRIVQDADIAIIGSAPDNYFLGRKEHSVTFRYSERLFKEMPLYRYFNLRYYWDLHHILAPRSDTEYLLAASAYTSHDYQFVHAYRHKVLKWGYFPKVIVNDQIPLKEKKPFELCWAGRFIDWKHPEQAVQLVKQLHKSGYSVHLTMVGDGDLFQQIKDEIVKNDLNECITLTGSLPYDQVRFTMEKASIFLFTSDRQEGWGAVLNEAMNSGCVCIANIHIGSVPFLIKNGINGFAYDGRLSSLVSAAKKILDHPELIEHISSNAYQTILNEWNAEIAVKRLLAVSSDIKNGNGLGRYQDGPLSYAEPTGKY